LLAGCIRIHLALFVAMLVWVSAVVMFAPALISMGLHVTGDGYAVPVKRRSHPSVVVYRLEPL
jgi:hypothetical protein